MKEILQDLPVTMEKLITNLVKQIGKIIEAEGDGFIYEEDSGSHFHTHGKEYIEEFKVSSTLIPDQSDEQLIRMFLHGLKNDVRNWVRLLNPTSCNQAKEFARHVSTATSSPPEKVDRYESTVSPEFRPSETYYPKPDPYPKPYSYVKSNFVAKPNMANGPASNNITSPAISRIRHLTKTEWENPKDDLYQATHIDECIGNFEAISVLIPGQTEEHPGTFFCGLNMSTLGCVRTLNPVRCLHGIHTMDSDLDWELVAGIHGEQNSDASGMVFKSSIRGYTWVPSGNVGPRELSPKSYEYDYFNYPSMQSKRPINQLSLIIQSYKSMNQPGSTGQSLELEDRIKKEVDVSDEDETCRLEATLEDEVGFGVELNTMSRQSKRREADLMSWSNVGISLSDLTIKLKFGFASHHEINGQIKYERPIRLWLIAWEKKSIAKTPY